jgi:hypothetical protein
MEPREPWQDERLGVAYHTVQHKHSLWSADTDTWQEQRGGSSFLRDLSALGDEGERIELTVISTKESRFGHVTITGEVADLCAKGSFSESWDSVEDLAETLQAGAEEVSERAPRTSEGEIGITVHFDVRATSPDELLRVLDAEEERLVSESEREWGAMMAHFCGGPL